MKIPLKYGLLIAVVSMAWIVITHNVVSNPRSIVHQLGTPIIFNIVHFAAIYLGIKALERAKGERPTFKEGLKTGVGIAFVYGLALALFFVVALGVIGTKFMAVEPGAGTARISASQIAQAFAGLLVMTLIFGLVYSTVISFFLAKRASDQHR